MKSRSECTCMCHKHPGAVHIGPCCTGFPRRDELIQRAFESKTDDPGEDWAENLVESMGKIPKET